MSQLELSIGKPILNRVKFPRANFLLFTTGSGEFSQALIRRDGEDIPCTELKKLRAEVPPLEGSPEELSAFLLARGQRGEPQEVLRPNGK